MTEKKKVCPGLNCNHTSGSPKAASQTARDAASSSPRLSLSVVLKHFKLICSQRKMGYDATVEAGNGLAWSIYKTFMNVTAAVKPKGPK